MFLERSTVMVEHPRKTAEVAPPITSLNLLLCRLWWCFVGPVILCFLAIQQSVAPDGWLAASDIGFLIVMLTTVGSRWVSFRAGDRVNAFGDIVGVEQLRRYSMFFLGGGTVVWIVTNVIGNRIFH